MFRLIAALASVFALLPPSRAADPRFIGFDPPELQFSDARVTNPDETDLARKLARGPVAARVAAARALWAGHSRRYAPAVVTFVNTANLADSRFESLMKDVDADLEPAAILRELALGDYRWGAYLAGLRPHGDLVPALLGGLESQPKYLKETMLALGKSKDPRALMPLTERLTADDYWTPSAAAAALGHLGNPAAEPDLLVLLANGKPFHQTYAAAALGRVGTAKSLPALQKLAASDEFTGAMNRKGVAAAAVAEITKRLKAGGK